MNQKIDDVSPLLKQFYEIKDKYHDYILFYRVGDFYEMFYDDAILVSHELELALTGKDCGNGKRAPMCGVPYHACDVYLGRLIQKGYKVAICEQLEDPATAKGLVKRDVIRIVTPGTVTEPTMLQDKKNNFLASIFFDKDGVGICFADISTAYISATCFPMKLFENEIVSELLTYKPSEIITNTDIKYYPLIDKYIKDTGNILVSNIGKLFDVESCKSLSLNQFGHEKFHDDKYSIVATGAILQYIKETQKIDISYIKNIDLYHNSQYLEMDSSTRRNLELTESMLTKDKKGSLLWVLDKTLTSMGARILRQRIEHPNTNVQTIIKRQQAIQEIYDNIELRNNIKDSLTGILDIERLITKIIYGLGSGRELKAISQTCEKLPILKSNLSCCKSSELANIFKKIDTLDDVKQLIDDSIVDQPPISLREGGIIKSGFNEELDKLRSIIDGTEDIIRDIENREKEKTGIKNLHIGYNRVFGYFIEVSKSQYDMVPDYFIRKQTLTNSERYITNELKQAEYTILSASEKINNLEYSIFNKIKEQVSENENRIRSTASALSELDFYYSLTVVAIENKYICPNVDYGDEIEIYEGRHPVVEKFVGDSYFVPNDVCLNTSDRKMILLTGPNMAGKSTYMRQCALIILLSQIGSFVPAKKANIGIVDKLFTRVGASDDLASGQSTFMMEMKEVANILLKATKKSFIIYDEIGRGTSTFDGMSIAKAVAEYTISNKISAKTMFATHYHELTSLESENPSIINYNVAVKKRNDELIFLRKIIRGPSDESYGIEVAKLAGIPNSIIRRAKQILSELEGNKKENVGISLNNDTNDYDNNYNISLEDSEFVKVRSEIKKINIDTLTPIEAMNFIYRWKKDINNSNGENVE